MRAVVCLLAVLAAGCSLVGDGDGPTANCAVGQTDGDLAILTWPDYVAPDVIAAFEESYSVTVEVSTYDTAAELGVEAATSSGGHDLIIASDVAVAALIGAGLLVGLDADALPNLANLDPAFDDLPFDPEGRLTVPYQWGTTGIGIDLGVTGRDVPRTWGLLFDEELAAEYRLDGEISILGDARETLGAALRYLGHSVNTVDDSALAEAQALVAGAVERGVLVDSDSYDELLLSGRTAVSHGYNGNFLVQFLEVDEPDQYTYFVPDEGGVRWVDTMSIAVGAASPCTAHAFIDFVLQPEQGAALTNWTYYASPNAAAEPFIDDAILANPVTYPPEDVELEFIADLGDAEADFVTAFRSAVRDEGG